MLIADGGFFKFFRITALFLFTFAYIFNLIIYSFDFTDAPI